MSAPDDIRHSWLQNTRQFLNIILCFPHGGRRDGPGPLINTPSQELSPFYPDAKLTASRLQVIQTHPEDVVTLWASTRYLHALRRSHALGFLGALRESCNGQFPGGGKNPKHYHTPGTRRQITSLVMRRRRYVAGNNALFRKFQIYRVLKVWNT